MLSASSSNNHSLFSFGQHGHTSDPDPVDQDDSPQYNFLPQVSFDDLQSSIESASGDFQLTQFPSPTGEGSILEAQGLGDNKMVDRPSTFRNGGTARVAMSQGQQQQQHQQPQQPQPTRSRTGSILRRGSGSNRQASISSTASTMSTASDARGQSTIRPRRQNQYPPVSNTNIAKPPRKSVGPGALDSTDYGNGPAVRRRPSLNSTTDRSGADSTRSSMDAGRDYPDTSRNMTASRAAKLKTISEPPPQRNGQSTADNASLTDPNRTSFLAPRSPRSSKTGSSTPGSNRRLSVMPSHSAHHASGLGARTISPTDTQRMKRRSFMPDAQNNAVVLEPPPPLLSDRPSSRSPSMLPRKTSTPSSQRTTPDANRKSYSSGLSVGSTTSYNTVRTSTGSLQARQPQNGASRLPAPKSANPLPPANPEDEEDVPPVPAIPKVYESPKDSPAELQFLDKVKSSLALDSSSLRSTASSGSLSGPAVHDTPRIQRKPSQRKVIQSVNQDPEKRVQPAQPAQPRRNLKSMNLPPLTVGPLSTPTVNKIAKLQQDQIQQARKASSPPARQITKTPTTPMTASRSTFFAKRMDHYRNRSSSSVHQSRVESPIVVDTSSSDSISGSAVKTTSVSPFLSSSVPKDTGFDQPFPKRSQTGSEVREPRKSEDTTKDSMLQQKPSGPRAQRQSSRSVVKPPMKPTEKSPILESSPEEPQTPSSMTSLRRKLSLSWKRSSSKNEKHIDPNNMKHDAMPPPRIPVSATTGNSVVSKTGSPSISAKPSASYLDSSRRRKTSGSSLNTAASHERTRSDGTQGSKAQPSIGRPPKVDGGDGAGNRPAMSHSASVMQKFLRSKASMQTVSKDVWTAELDKDDLIAEEEMKKLGSRRKETELAAKTLDTLRKRASPKERVSPQDAIRIAMLNIFERGEIIDYNDIFFCGTQNAQKVVGDLKSDRPNFGYDDDRGDYTIVIGDHLAYRYEIVDVLGKGSFGQVVRCIDHKTGVLVAVKIIRNKKRFHQQALVEVNILQKLREWVSTTAEVNGACRVTN